MLANMLKLECLSKEMKGAWLEQIEEISKNKLLQSSSSIRVRHRSFLKARLILQK